MEEMEDNDIHEINYIEAEKIIGLEMIKENHNLLNESLNLMKDLISICVNMNFSQLDEADIEWPENLDLLINKCTKNEYLKLEKEDLLLHITNLVNMSKQANNLNKEMSENIKDLSFNLSEHKKELDDSYKQYEINIQNLAIPLISNQTKKRKLLNNIYIKSYKNSIENLNTVYNKYLKANIEEFLKLTESVLQIEKIKDNINVLFKKLVSRIMNAFLEHYEQIYPVIKIIRE